MKSLLFGLAILASVASGQTRPKNSYRGPGGAPTAPARPVSPEVHPDRTITFRLPAPQVSTVSLLFGGSKPMTKDAAGLWSITIGPMEPEIYTYNFLVDGVRILDAGTNNIKNGHFLDSSVVEVPGSPARFDEVRNVPHGALGIRTYTSSPLQILRHVYVYTPPQYDAEPNRKFPVLYLRHGSGDSEQNWSDTGRAGVILDNLIAEHKAQPMIIVMPNGDVDNNITGGSTPRGLEVTAQELLADVMPLVESNYRVLAGRENRAITGLSMGGGQAFTSGLKHTDLFAWVGEFSSGLVSDAEFKVEKAIPGAYAEAAKLRMLYLSCGTEDPRFPGHLDLIDDLKAHNVNPVWFPTPGNHEWKVWRHSLADFAPRLFRDAVPVAPATLKSPEVLSDHRVTFRIFAPRASEVSVSGDWIAQGRGTGGKLAKGTDGVWSITVGPLVPDFYSYAFNVDGVRTIDPKNAMIKQGEASLDNMFLVDGDEAAFEMTRAVPHGQIHIDWYQSNVLDKPRSMHVYTPPGYEDSKAKLPVFYLLHGGGDEDSGWSTIGRAGFILDNLIAAKKAKPMIIVMPNGSMPRPNFTSGAPQTPALQQAQREAQQKFVDELIDNVMPAVGKNYRVIANRESRAIAGLSMGAGQTVSVISKHLDKFAWIGVWSGGGNNPFTGPSDQTNKQIKLLWIAAGKSDTLAGPGTKRLAESLDAAGIKHQYQESEGGHTWINWRRYLNDYAQLLFR
jgi:enterochelin esterase-like enzyme